MYYSVTLVKVRTYLRIRYDMRNGVNIRVLLPEPENMSNKKTFQ